MSQRVWNDSPPEWLTDSFVERCLRQGLEETSLKITKFDVDVVSLHGDNYGSKLFRIDTQVRRKDGADEETLKMIAKTMPSGLMGEFVRSFAVFDVEEEAFARALPDVLKVLRKAYPDQDKFWPDCYYQSSSPHHIILLEDLTASGYAVLDRSGGADLNHCLAVLEPLAKLHAASMVMLEENPNVFEKFDNYFWNRQNSMIFRGLFEIPINLLAREVKTWPGFERGSIIGEKLKCLNIPDIVSQTWTRDDYGMHALIHGDAWITNWLFRYGEHSGDVSGVKILDFQRMTVHSPTFDLQHLIFTSIRYDTTFRVIDTVVERYYEMFVTVLDRLGRSSLTTYTFDEFQQDFEKSLFWGFVEFCSVAPLIKLMPEDAIHPDDFFTADKTSLYRKLLEKSEVRDFLQEGLLYFEKKGVF